MNRRNQILIVGAAVVAVLFAVGAWYFFIRDDAPPPLTLDDALANSTTLPPVTDPPAPEPTEAPDPTPAPSTEPPAATDAPAVPTTADPEDGGAWTIDPDGTIVGYRIEEELAGIGGNTAVGRTSNVTGSLSLDEAGISSVSVTVDMTTLVSDDGRRDRQLRGRGLQTDQFPEASFELETPIVLDTVPQVGVTITATAEGTLTLHGVSRSVTIDLEAQLVDDATIVVVGAAEVALADYDIEPPTGFSVLSVADTGLFEFQLTFKA